MKKRTPLNLFLFLFALYLLTYSPTLHSSDGQAMFATAESLARRGAWDIEQIRWMDLQQGTYGLDGLLYSRKGVGQPLLALPLAWLGLVLPWFGPLTLTLLFSSFITALTGLLIFTTLKKLGYDPQTGCMAALIYGTATLAWPYAKTFFSDPLAGFLLLATTLALITFNQTGQKRYALIAGLNLAWAAATRYAEGIFLPVFGLLFLAYLYPNQQSDSQSRVSRNLSISPLLSFSIPIAIIGAGLMFFNISRYGNPLNTGYLPEETFSAIWWQGILGQLLSPGRGLLLFSPILLASFFGLKSFWQHHRLETLTCLAVILVHLLLYGKWFMWHGGFAWGPRFMIPTLPFWIILMAPALAQLPARPAWRFGFYILWAISVIMQIPGLSVDFDLWQNRLLQTGHPLFAPITFFAPIYSPLLGTWEFITLQNLDLAWVTNGQIAWQLLAILLINLLLTSRALFKNPAAKKSPSSLKGEGRGKESSSRFRLTSEVFKNLGGLSAMLNIVTTFLLLQHAHQTLPAGLSVAMTLINQTDATIIYNDPEKAIAIAESYQGHAAILGMAALDSARLDTFTAQSPVTWWLSSYQDEIEAYLLTTYGVARRETFGDQRLLLLARPDGSSQPINTHFGEAISLQFARLSSRLQPNAPFAIELTWQATQTPPADYQVFIHLLDADGQTVAQTDGQPVHWSRPTTTWLPGETIIDRHAFWSADLPPGTYTLITGLYRPANGERLPTKTGEDFIKLQTLVINP